MGMCCEKMMMTGWRNEWNMKLRVQGQEEDQRGSGERLSETTVKLVNWTKRMPCMDRCKWRKMIKDVRWSGWVWVDECFFWYRPTRVVPDKRPLNGCVCVCVWLPYHNVLGLSRTSFSNSTCKTSMSIKQATTVKLCLPAITRNCHVITW